MATKTNEPAAEALEPMAEERASTLETQAYERIKQAILSKELKPGEKVSHTEWAERLNFSRTPVRDALKRLEFEGFIIRETERQWHVYTLTIQDIYKLYDVIQSVEGFIAYLAAQNFTDAMAEEASKLLRVMDEGRKHHDYGAYLPANGQFHALMETAANNEKLVEISRLTREKMARVPARDLHLEGRLDRSYEENRLIIDALTRRDAEAADRHQRAHLRSSRDYMILLLEKLIIPYVGPEF